jgi:catechol 2,3-dioxygenase-like lactoylglutathione lyase family enzyme
MDERGGNGDSPLNLVTLGVEDLERAARFYEEALSLPRLPTPPGVVFFALGQAWLALYPRETLASGVEADAAGDGSRAFVLAHNVGSPEEVDRLLAHVARHGGRIVKTPQPAESGGYSGYFTDPEGFLWEIAHDPHPPPPH